MLLFKYLIGLGNDWFWPPGNYRTRSQCTRLMVNYSFLSDGENRERSKERLMMRDNLGTQLFSRLFF
ncbi:hypothetical protein CIPAW_08G005000 [Carya illinoinensis]|uniref:Uncharacterized protein n=1 Tax=Carya illinoinensis TaxID=32201 RepID=A0A8T1PP81_CARIL|nr:hypothetical protein CIPAW_08G005000 [Carya illinoinensis]